MSNKIDWKLAPSLDQTIDSKSCFIHTNYKRKAYYEYALTFYRETGSHTKMDSFYSVKALTKLETQKGYEAKPHKFAGFEPRKCKNYKTVRISHKK